MIQNAIHFLASVESEVLDFKQESYKLGKDDKKNEILKDVSAFANHPSNEDKYIILGVIEKDEKAIGFQNVDTSLTETNYQQFIYESIEPRINFSYELFEHKGFKLAYFRMFNNIDRPYLLRKDVDSKRNDLAFKKGSGFIRDKTLTRRLERQDFEGIYTERFKKGDRKYDIKIEEVVDCIPGDGINSQIYYLDINIENTSNQSFGFNIELSIPSGECITLCELEAQDKDPGTFLFSSFDICSTQSGSRTVYSTCIKQKDGFDIHLDQASKQYNVFNNQILFLAKTITATLIIRSDDFDKPMIRELTFNQP